MSDEQTQSEEGYRPGEEPLSDMDVARAMDIADNCLDEAEQVIWTTAGRAQSQEATDRLEQLVHDMWEFQNRLTDIRDDLRQVESDGGVDSANGFEWGR